jgi:hypothetical protein
LKNGSASKETNLGQEQEKLTILNAKVVAQIQELSDFVKHANHRKRRNNY